MKKNYNILKRYIEAIVYCVLLVVSTLLCVSNNIFIKMIPIAFITGIIGQIVFGKKFMTSFFSFILAIILLQIKVPSDLLSNVTITCHIALCCLIGEIFGWNLKSVINLFKGKNNKKKVKLKIQYIGTCIVTLIIGGLLNSIVNGNYISYFKVKDILNNHFIKEYASSSRFEIISSKYIFSDNKRYVFYAKDTLNNDEVGKFSIYLQDDKKVQDEYKEQVYNSISKNLNNSIETIEKIQDTNIEIQYDTTNSLVISFEKKIEEINRNEIEKYAKEITIFLDNIKKIENVDKIEQMKIVLESTTNSKESLASYIYMNGYNEMLNNKIEEPYNYIMRALNIEYFD